MKHLSPAEIETIRVPEPKHDPFTLESLVAWLEKMPADGEYNFYCAESCMVAQWVISIDPLAEPAPYFGSDFYYVNGHIRDFSEFVRIANNGLCDFTFSAALTRARAALASQKGNANG